MANPFDVKLADLPAEERAEIEAQLAARPRETWLSDEGDGLAFHLLVAIAAIAGIVATFVVVPVPDMIDFFRFMAISPMSVSASPVLGAIFAVLVLMLVAWRFKVLHGRHGWMATSFGLVRVRGPRLRVVRWADVVELRCWRVGHGLKGFVMTSLTTPRGTLECDTAALYTEFQRRVPSTAKEVSELK